MIHADSQFMELQTVNNAGYHSLTVIPNCIYIRHQHCSVGENRRTGTLMAEQITDARMFAALGATNEAILRTRSQEELISASATPPSTGENSRKREPSLRSRTGRCAP
jgi:hypothetical protein